MESNSFKSTLFGGFRRKDVIDYIEKSASESSERISALEKSGGRLSQENATLRDDLASVTDARDRLSDALADNLGKQESLSAALNEAKDALETLRAHVAALTAERDALRAEVEKLRPQAEEYSAVKSNIADIELSARRRADELEAETRARLRDMIDACRQQYTQAMAVLNDACVNITKELHKTDSSISKLPTVLESVSGEFDSFKEL